MNDTNIERFLIGGVVFTFVTALAWFALNNQLSISNSVQAPTLITTVTPLVADDVLNDDGSTDVLGDELDVVSDEPTALPELTATLTDDELAVVNEEMMFEETPTPDIILAIPTEIPVEEPTAEPTIAYEEPTPEPTAIPEPTATPTATPVPIELIRGEVRWSGEKRVLYDVVVDQGATLIIEPNTTVFMEAGTSFYIDGNVRALGSATAPVRITSDGQAWGGMFVRAGGDVILIGTVLSRGGGGSTLMVAEQASVVMRDSQLNNNLGQIQLRDSAFTFENSTMRDNQLPYGAAVDAKFSYNSAFRMINSRVGPNIQAAGAPAVAIKTSGSATELTFELNGSLLTNQSGPNLQLESAADMAGSVQCNAFVAGDVGISLRTSTTQLPVFGLFVRNNAFEQHRGNRTNQYEPHQGNTWRTLYGMTSNVAANAQENWWDHATGPYDPKRYTTGRGELAGVNVDAGNWLTVRPVCAPQP
ncbi:MAG: PT domain-containing protein [Roseiflexaceae bacterium]